VENLVGTEDEHGRWPVDADELRVPVTDAAAVGHFVGESINGARSHCFLLNNESARLSPTWCANCRCFIGRLVNLYDCRTALGRR
jgi:hypothetical protein